jgi:hypothetical protein
MESLDSLYMVSEVFTKRQSFIILCFSRDSVVLVFTGRIVNVFIITLLVIIQN